ncbi:NitT/TauT family transport system permease protein [Amorphus suaedae]
MDDKLQASVVKASSGNAVSGFEHRPFWRRPAARRLYRLFDPAIWFGIGTIVVLLVLLEYLINAGVISRLIVAPPSKVLLGLADRENLLELLHAMRLTASLILTALALEVLVALPLGYFLYRFANYGRAYEAWLASLFAAPIFLLYPLFMVIFGRNSMTLVAMGFAAGVVPVIVYARLAFLSVSPTLIRVGRSYGLTERQIFRMIMIPAGAPVMFTGIRLGLIYTMINIIAIEYLVDYGGLGKLVSDRYFRFNIDGTYTAITAVTVVTILLNYFVRKLEKMVR